jgi:fructokinase
VALGLVNVICALSPQRIILGGGVMREPTLLSRVQGRLRDLLAGYFDAPELKDGIDDFVVRPGLGDRAGVLGAIALAQAAAAG